MNRCEYKPGDLVTFRLYRGEVVGEPAAVLGRHASVRIISAPGYPRLVDSHWAVRMERLRPIIETGDLFAEGENENREEVAGRDHLRELAPKSH